MNKLDLELTESDNGNLHLTFHSQPLVNKQVDIKITPDSRVYVEGLIPVDEKISIFNILKQLVTQIDS